MTVALKYAILFVLVVLMIGAADTSFAALVLNEIMADPASDWDGSGSYSFRDDEWLEVLNTGPGVEDLSQYYVRDIPDPEPHLQLFGLLEPGQAQVFFGGDAVAWQQVNDITVTGLSLNNTGDTVELLRWTGSDYQLVYSAVFTDHEAEDERSSGRDPATGQWLLFDALNPHLGTQEPLGTGCAPSPGAPNQCVVQVPTQPAAWDQVKSLYR